MADDEIKIQDRIKNVQVHTKNEYERHKSVQDWDMASIPVHINGG